MEKYLLKLYITGQTPRSLLAIANLKRICEESLGGRFELQILDILQLPEIAEEARILATPTVIKDLPPPARRIIGDLSDADKVLSGLELEGFSKLRASEESAAEVIATNEKQIPERP